MTTNDSFKLVLLTRDGPEHRYVTREFAARFPGALRAVILADPPHRSLVYRARTWWRRYTVPQLVSRVVARAYQAWRGAARRRAAAARRVLFDGGEPPSLPEALIRRVPSHNGPDCLDLLDRIAPDVIAVYGTAMIRPPVFRRALIGIVNMHTGLSPYYRGADTIFWPLHEGEPHMVGVTIHLIDEGVDSGPILATGRPDIEETDDEDTLFFKCVRLGTRIYEDSIRALVAGTAKLEPQDLDLGRSYRFVHRTVGAERRVEGLLRGGLLRRYAGTR